MEPGLSYLVRTYNAPEDQATSSAEPVGLTRTQLRAPDLIISR